MDDALVLPVGGDLGAESDDRALVDAARSDARAFESLYLRYVDRVYGYLRARTGSEEDAADLTQGVFLRALDALPRYTERGAPFAVWLFRIARNAAVDAHRRKREALSWDVVPERLHPEAGGAAGADPEGAALAREERARLREALARLSDRERELVALRCAGGLSLKEIAVVIGRSESTVHRQLAKAFEEMKEHYGAR